MKSLALMRTTTITGVFLLLILSIQAKPTPQAALDLLKQGNSRFAAGKSRHTRANRARFIQAGK